jgi:hypothetical protein
LRRWSLFAGCVGWHLPPWTSSQPARRGSPSPPSWAVTTLLPRALSAHPCCDFRLHARCWMRRRSSRRSRAPATFAWPADLGWVAGGWEPLATTRGRRLAAPERQGEEAGRWRSGAMEGPREQARGGGVEGAGDGVGEIRAPPDLRERSGIPEKTESFGGHRCRRYGRSNPLLFRVRDALRATVAVSLSTLTCFCASFQKHVFVLKRCLAKETGKIEIEFS